MPRDEDAPIIASAVPLEGERRDALGNLCFCLHVLAMLFITFGWALSIRGLLIFYLMFLPCVAVQWQINRDSCVLNNIESLIRSGRWRDPNNREEGAWLHSLARRALGLTMTPRQVGRLTRAALVLFWLLALGHLLFWP